MTEAQKVRAAQREESEARDIIHDIDRLNTFPENKKSRWVWELLQNAKDVATEDGVNITYELKNNQVIFSHDGLPFETENLLAILYKTSTKSLGSDDGTTGKYGTGFVTTHILSKKLNITGVHQLKEDNSLRNFTISIDRSSALLEETKALDEMKKAINSTFDQINAIESQLSENIQNFHHSFTYDLSETSLKYALQGLEELEKNLPFVLLINKSAKKKINSVTVIKNGSSKVFRIHPTESKILGVKYIKTQENEGILYKENDNLIIGIPVVEEENNYALAPIEGKCVLYKEFPLIGSENFHLPVFIQHKNFKPTEERDGVRTKKENEEREDAAADINRVCLIEFTSEYLDFISLLINNNCLNSFILALSGLPEFVDKYHNVNWYEANIQAPIRQLLLKYPIVETQNGNSLTIGDTKFPVIELAEDVNFYALLEAFIPSQIPSKKSLNYWNKCINQQQENWVENSTINLEHFLDTLPDYVNVSEEISILNLLKVYDYLTSINSKLGENYPIYLNANKEFKTRDQVTIYPLIDDQIKFVAKELNRDLDQEFLYKSLGKVTDIKDFDLSAFYKSLNSELISPLKVEDATKQQIKAILHINTLFKTDRANKREEWLKIIQELLPDKIGNSQLISIDYENFHYPAELWTAKYLCWLIQEEQTFESFSNTYFSQNNELAYQWLSKFINYISSSREDIKNYISKYKIIPLQNGSFTADAENIFKEDNPKYFDKVLKDIVKEHGKYDVYTHLISNELAISNFRETSVSIITDKIDNLFLQTDISSKVGKGGELHHVFLEINSWFEKHSDAATYLKTFAVKRDMLYVISLGEGFSKQIMALNNSGKSMEDITELANIKLSTKEMKALEKVATELGTDELLKKAKEMIQIRDQRIKWKQIGNTAEDAFKKVFENIEFEMQIENPDVGKDFELILKSKTFSIEIKNVIDGKENVRMSILQGRTAVKEKENYTLCVVTRPDDVSEITEEYFIQNAKFIKDIGYQIGNKISDWDNGLHSLSKHEEINVYLDEKKESVYVNRSIWRAGISFEEYVEFLKEKTYETH